MEKGEIAHFEQFHPFQQCFPKAFFSNVLERIYMEERATTNSRLTASPVGHPVERIDK